MWGETNKVTLNLCAKHLTKAYELPQNVATDDQVRIFCQEKIKADDSYILTKVDRLGGKLVEVTFVTATYDKEDYDAYIVLEDFYIRNKKLYLRSAGKSPLDEWKTSLHLLCTSFFKILYNEIYCNPTARLRLRAVACTVAVPTVALMGVLMPFASYYFNRIVGDLDCWMNGFTNFQISTYSSSSRGAISRRCLAIDLQPYAYLKGAMLKNTICIRNLSLEKYADKEYEPSSRRIVDYIFTKYKNMGVVVVNSFAKMVPSYHRLIEPCVTEPR